jgi:integrating conjugative element membrane protein (TIGR03747 family)
MAEAVADPRRRVTQPGVIGRTLTLLAQGLKWLCLSLLFSVLIEWAGMRFWWPEEGLAHSRAMLAAEIGYLQGEFDRSLLTQDPAGYSREVADTAHHLLFGITRLAALVEWLNSAPAAEESGWSARLREHLRPVVTYLVAAMQVTQVFAVRLAILTLATPVFLLFGLVALVDGLVRRDLRRWGGGRESSFVYHWAKRSALPLLVLAWVIYLALPFSLHPSFVILPFATLFALSLAVTASTFKKYL